MTPIFFLNPHHPYHGGVDWPSGNPGAPSDPPNRHTYPQSDPIFLIHFHVGNDMSSCPKIANDTHLFSQPTSSMPWGRRSAIWDPGGPHQTPQTAIHTPKAAQFSLSTFNIGKDPSSCPKISIDTHLFSQPTSSMPWGRRSAIWDPGGPHQTPQTAIHTPKTTQFS